MSIPFNQPCGCSDCEAAVSPAAYLTALLDYALKHVRKNGTDKIDLALLVDTLYQPFTDLPTDCDAVEQPLDRVRICSEVLRKYLGSRPLADPMKEAMLANAEAAYTFAVYAKLLTQLGTSYEEIRRIRNETVENRQALAARLGITLTEPRPADVPDDDENNGDELDQLFLDPGAIPPKDHLLTEQTIEKLFGLADTSRDPLSKGAKLGDDQRQITRWNMDGMVWGQNTDPDGRVYIALTNPGPSVFRVDVYQDFPRTTLVASGETTTASGTVKLVPENNSQLSGVFEIAYTLDTTNISIAAIPALVSWQLKHLRTLWTQQDYPTDAYSDDALPVLPLIDPDLIGPDDFRVPEAKRNPGDPDKAFDIWLKRRAFVDTALHDLQTMRETNGLAQFLQQEFGTPLPDIDGLFLALTQGSTGKDIATARDTLATLGLTVESFTFLLATRTKDQVAQSDPRNEQVSASEWSEVYSILAQARKVTQFQTWRNEEQAIPLTLEYKEFWFPVITPQEGEWPPVTMSDQPFIDPSLMKVTDLPEWLAGKAAIALWNTRKTTLDQLSRQIKQARETNGFDAMMQLALGNPAAGDPLQYNLDTLNSNLNSLDETARTLATQQIETDLHLSTENFKRLVVIKAANDQPDPVKKPTSAEWDDVYTMLSAAHKIKHDYPQWIQEETAAGFVYWQALKAKLPHWRASLEARLAWQQAVRIRNQLPIIAPMIVEPADLLHVIPGNVAFDLWKARYDQIAAWRAEVQTSREGAADALTGIDQIMKETLGVEPSDLEALDQERQAGHSIEKRLDQLLLTNASFLYLLQIRGLAQTAQPITASEWDTVYATLVQVKSTFAYAAYRMDEHAKQVLLAPDFFKVQIDPIATLGLSDPATPLWLSRWQARRDWQDTLQSRIDQEHTLVEGLRSAIHAVEATTLPALRDALIAASDAVGVSLDAQAEWMTGRLLIDTKTSGGQNTTRIAQALETLQTLIFDLRTGQFKQVLPFALSLVSDAFDEEWQWIGSYATFRAATFVFIYPENILQPSLLHHKTPAFTTLVAETRTVRLTPTSATSQATAYAEYFQDVCSLNIGATCQASTRGYAYDDRDNQPSGPQLLFYMFAQASSGKLYWSAYHGSSPSAAYAQTFWQEIPDIGNIGAGRIIGAMPYRETVSDKRYFSGYKVQTSYVYLFYLIGKAGKQTLQFAKMNLDRFGSWDGTQFRLSKPPLAMLASLEIVPIQTQSEFTLPGLVFHAFKTNEFYLRTLNHDGTDWDQSAADWLLFHNTVDVGQIDLGWREIKAVLTVNGDTWFVIRQLLSGDKAGICIIKGGGHVTQFEPGAIDFGGNVIAALPGPESNIKLLAPKPYTSDIFIFVKDSFSGACNYQRFANDSANHPILQALADLVTIPPHSGYAPAGQTMVAYQREKNAQSFYMYTYTASGDKLVGSAVVRAVPRVQAPLNIPLHLTETLLQQRRQDIINAFALNSDASASLLAYLREAFYFVPLHLALALQTAGQYLAALDCFRTLYDYEALIGPPSQRNIYYGLELDRQLPAASVYEAADGWLLDPLNPHLIAATRSYAYTRFTLMSLARCMLDFADSEFSQETGESLATARTLYLSALGILQLPELQQKLGVCDDLIATLQIEPGKAIPPEVPAAVGEIQDALTVWASSINNFGRVFNDVTTALQGAGDWSVKLGQARNVVQEAIVKTSLQPMTGGIVSNTAKFLQERGALLIRDATIDEALQGVSKHAAGRLFEGTDINLANILGSGKAPQPFPPVVIYPSLQFCIPPNPMLKALRLHAELNLFKLRSSRNIAGMKRQLEPYAAPTDTTSGLPTIGSGGQVVLSGLVRLQPTLYRYPVLIERAKQLVNLAAQVEASMLSALEKRDAEALTVLQARQQLNLAQAGVRLQDLLVTEAQSGVTLATLQQSRAQLQVDYFTKLLQTPISELEQDALDMLGQAADYQVEAAGESTAASTILAAIAITEALGAAGTAYFSPGTALQLLGSAASHTAGALSASSSGNSSLAAAASTRASIAATRASYERRTEDWTYQQSLANTDVEISAQQIAIANQHVDVTKQERVIAGIQADNARDTITYLINQFSSVELYDWMSNLLEGVYRFFLQQATSMANLAENQLAFERQEVPPAYIQSDYWEVSPDTGALVPPDDQSSDRRGLTGSARLLQDIYQLDQYAFNTAQRKLQLTKTISLAQFAPVEFQQFLESGVLPFTTPMELFDRDFPGHYLRLIKHVRTSVIALIPPVQGIHATLSTTGPSRVAIGGDVFQTVVIRRNPEFVALSTAINATGLLDLEPQPDMLLPFEGSGVEMTWEFILPKAANQIDFHTIADVLITIDYTALNSFDYRQQVLQSLKPTMTADRPFSFRNQFADQWYDLHNPDQTSTPMTVRFTMFREDFPPNIMDLKIQQVLLYFVRRAAVPFEMVANLRYTAQDEPGTVGGRATSIDGIMSTRRGNASSWTAMSGKAPIGVWELALPNTEEVKDRFSNEEIADLLLVITYAGRTSNWPT